MKIRLNRIMREGNANGRNKNMFYAPNCKMASDVCCAVLHTKHFAHLNEYEFRVENISNDSHDT